MESFYPEGLGKGIVEEPRYSYAKHLPEQPIEAVGAITIDNVFCRDNVEKEAIRPIFRLEAAVA